MQTTVTEQGQGNKSPGNLPQKIGDRIDSLNAMAALFAFFSRCLEREIDADFLNSLRGELKAPLDEAGFSLGEDLLSGEPAEVLDRYAEEYTALFVAPGCISPYASVFETGSMFKEPADRASAAYAQAGWVYKNQYSGEFPDHIGTMLGFYGILSGHEAQLVSQGDFEQADAIKQSRESFLKEQLAGWGPGWCHLAAQAANLAFYRQLLEMTEQALWLEISQILDRREVRDLVELNRREPKRLDYDADFRKASGL